MIKSDVWVSFAKEPYKRDDILQKRPSIVSSLLKTAGKWQKCKLVSGHALCGQQHGLAMNWVDQPRTSADERDVVCSPRYHDCVWAVQGLVVFSLTSRFFVNSQLDHFRAWIPACSVTSTLLHRCFPSNLSTTMQGAIVKLRKLRTVLGYVGKRGWGVEGISAAGRGYNEVLALELRSVG